MSRDLESNRGRTAQRQNVRRRQRTEAAEIVLAQELGRLIGAYLARHPYEPTGVSRHGGQHASRTGAARHDLQKRARIVNGSVDSQVQS